MGQWVQLCGPNNNPIMAGMSLSKTHVILLLMLNQKLRAIVQEIKLYIKAFA